VRMVFPVTLCTGSMKIVKAICGPRRPRASIASEMSESLPYSTREGLSLDEVDSVLASEDGNVWSSGPAALDALRQGRMSSIRAGKGLPGNQVTSLLEDQLR